MKLKGKTYRTVARPALVYGAETWSTTKSQERRREGNEMRMLRWMSGVTEKDRIRNEHVRGSVEVAPVALITEIRPKWYVHIRSKEERHC